MNIKKRSKEQEDKIAKEIGGKPTIASGALYFQKADARTDSRENGILVEAKYTDKERYMLTLNTWKKIEREALRDGMRTPVMNIELKPYYSLAVFDLNFFHGLDSSQYSLKLIMLKEVTTRVAIDSTLVKTHLDSIHTIPYSLAVFEDTQLMIMNWSDFLLLLEL